MRRLAWCAAAILAAASPLAAQRTTPRTTPRTTEPAVRECVFDFNKVTDELPRVNAVQQPSGAYNSFIGGRIRGYCPQQKITIIADSLENYGDAKIYYLIGNVHYEEPRLRLDAQRATYWQGEERVRAEGGVDATLPSGTNLKGPVVDYYRAIPRTRPMSRMLAPGRPTILIIEQDTMARAGQPAKPGEPTSVVANTVVMEQDSLVYASGRVEITRTDVVARGDSAYMDNGRQYAKLMRNPSVEGKGERPFTLSGRLVEIWGRTRQLERARSGGDAKLVSRDMTLTSDTLDFRVTQSKIERLYAWGGGRAHAISPTYDIQADSLDVRMPGQRLRELHALRNARAESEPDSTKIESEERDWMQGDTILALFDSSAAADTSKQPEIKQLTSIGNARSFYQFAHGDSLTTRPGINYVRGASIVIGFKNRAVNGVSVTQQVAGVTIEPKIEPATPPRRGNGRRGNATPQTRGTTTPAAPAGRQPARPASPPSRPPASTPKAP